MIPRALEAEIVRLYHAEHWRIGTIATQLRVHHSTVRRVLLAAGVELAPKVLRASIIDPYRVFIVETLTKYPGLRASRLYSMVKARGYRGAPDHFRALVAGLRPRPVPEAYLRLRTLAGEQAQADWAAFGKLTIGRAARSLMAFVMVLSYSRRLFLRFYLNAAMANFLRGHLEAFGRWNAVPRVILYDYVAGNIIDVM
jgi:transposase